MINIRTVKKQAFRVAGKKTWIAGTASDQFGLFWQRCREDGTLESLRRIGEQPGSVTGGTVLGVSCVEKDPAVRNFYFIICVECPGGIPDDFVGKGMEEHIVPAAEWAVFQNTGSMPDALIAAEMRAFAEWLPASGCKHAFAPEMEVYPPCPEGDETLVEYWLPIVEND